MFDTLRRRAQLILFVVFLSLLSAPALAELEGFVVWQPDPNGVRYVLPKVKGMTPKELATKWQKTVKASKVYGKMENAQFLNLSTAPGTFSALPKSTPEHPNVQVVLNRPNQMTDKSPYLRKVVESFEREGPNLFSIPVGLETVLNADEMTDFRKRLNSFDGQLGVGGDDPHPKMYASKGDPKTLKEKLKETSGDISFKRDIEQSEYIQEYLKNGKGRVMYICGSMQRAAIKDGHDFHADIGKITSIEHKGSPGTVMLEIVAQPDSELAVAAGSTRFQTSNYHHAGVNAGAKQEGKDPGSKITAYNIEPDGTRGQVVKAVEFADNAGFATQFHPEFRGSPEEIRIVKYVSTGWKMRGRYAPAEIVSCMGKSLENLLPDAGGGMAP